MKKPCHISNFLMRIYKIHVSSIDIVILFIYFLSLITKKKFWNENTKFFTILYKYILTFTKNIMKRLFWVSLWFMKEVIRYCLLLETGWLVPHCASTEAATARLHGFLFWTLERHGIKCRSNIWKRFLPGVQEFLFNQKINLSPYCLTYSIQ